jgi:hypothetical protein
MRLIELQQTVSALMHSYTAGTDDPAEAVGFAASPVDWHATPALPAEQGRG